MERDPDSKCYTLERLLPPGKYPYKFIYSGRWTVSADHPTLQVWPYSGLHPWERAQVRGWLSLFEVLEIFEYGLCKGKKKGSAWARKTFEFWYYVMVSLETPFHSCWLHNAAWARPINCSAQSLRNVSPSVQICCSLTGYPCLKIAVLAKAKFIVRSQACMQDGDNCNNYLEVLGDNSDATTKQARLRLLSEDGFLTDNERLTLQKLLH